MSDLDDLLIQILGKTFEHADSGIDDIAWTQVRRSGLDRVGLAEELGGSGGGPADAVAVTVRTAQAGLSAPTPEMLLVAPYLATRLQASIGQGLVGVCALDGRARPENGGTRITGLAPRVPWGTACSQLWVLVPADHSTVVVAALNEGEWNGSALERTPDPRAEIQVDALVEPDRVHRIGSDAADDVFALGAFGRSCQLLGAMRASLQATTIYVTERHQFGKPLTAHQVVRHQVVSMVNEVAAAEAAVAHATALLGPVGAPLSKRARVAIAATKVQTSLGGTLVARTAHQLHGALGMTAEHVLHAFTTRIWEWRDEYGSDHYWSAQIAELIDDQYDSNLWRALADQTAHA
jgi:acyl-CoA dehydrogenase